MADSVELSDFERGMLVGARLAGTSVAKTAEMLNVSRRTVIKMMSAWETEEKRASSLRRDPGDPSELPAQSEEPEDSGHSLQPGDWVLVKVHQKKSSMKPQWKGPFQVTVTNKSTVKCQGHTNWINASRCKKVAHETSPEDQDTAPPESGGTLQAVSGDHKQ